MTDQTTARYFVEFAVRFYSFTKAQYRQEEQVKAGSMAFLVLLTLKSLSDRDLTMSDLAQEMMITKQQLTRLVNDLEEKGLVERIHNQNNRRQVYIRISGEGCRLLDQLKGQMLNSTEEALEIFAEEERKEIDACLSRLLTLFSRLEGFGGRQWLFDGKDQL